MAKINSILFICTGNSCRSVMAEALMRRYLKEKGKSHIKVGSAGMSAVDGFPPTEFTIEVMKNEGLDVSRFKSRRLTKELLDESDLVLVMEDMHKDQILEEFPQAKDKTFLLKEYMAKDAREDPFASRVPDPIGRPVEYYKYSLEMIKKEVKRIAELV